MAEPYLADLTKMSTDWMEANHSVGVLECRHFFSGAAVYRDGSIVASLTPVGLAFKVKADVRQSLLDSGRASPLRYFPESPIKHDYVLFADSSIGICEATRLLVGDELQS
jgi:TfoX/Sxy family transcriptional regulator of competence genes